MVLPPDTNHSRTDHWETYDFPLPHKPEGEDPSLELVRKHLPNGGRLVEVASLDRVGQLAFKGLRQLNVVQSVVFEAAYNSAENLLISAPTGAGKTNIALLTIIHLIKQNIDPNTGVLATGNFKVISIFNRLRCFE